MHQVHVHVVGAQSTQAVVDLAQDRVAPRVAARLAGRVGRGHQPAFGGDHRAVAPTHQRGTERLFGVAGSVTGGSVEAGDAAVQRAVDSPDGLGVVDAAVAIAAHRPATEGDRRDR
jgi:hypothetical protein